MKTNKDIEIDVMGVHNLFWESYANRDIELRFSLCSEDVTFIGSGMHERAMNKTEYKKINLEGVKQFPDSFQIEFLWTNLTMLNKEVACIESEVVWSQLINDETSKELIRNTTILKYDNNKWFVTHVHGSVPDYRLKDGDYMTNEQTIIRNRELERQVFERTQDLNKTLVELAEKNRELEIETALEKVRAIAMGMKEPADMLNVCKTISLQLHLLGVKEIRNVQTAIFYEQRGTYMNYEYYAKHNKTFITETVFTDSEIHNEFAAKMIKGKGEAFTIHVNGNEVKDWIAYQKTTNVFIDKYLETASSLNYYWFSLGPVALGNSTYHPLTEEEINLFKRFLKVFELAYQRYLDIEQAETQAREAQIELALERVRARTMAMQKSEELSQTARVLFQQFKELGEDPDQLSIGIVNESEKVIEIWLSLQGNIMNQMFKAPIDEPTVINKIYTAWKEKKKSVIIDISGDELERYNSYLNSDEDFKEYNDVKNKIGKDEHRRIIYSALFSKGLLSVATQEPRSEETIKLLERFAGVFDGTYTRFLDLQKAEAQAREAQIEAALERVRSRSMGMQKSEELRDVIQVVYDQLVQLNFNISNAGFLMDYRESNDGNIWMADALTEIPTQQFIPYFDHPFNRDYLEQKEKGPELFTRIYSFEEKNSWLENLFNYLPWMTEELKKLMNNSPALAISRILLKNIGLYLFNFNGTPYTDAENDTLMRISKVFEQTYIRFNDLKKAEAQAREAQIETSLEKVRSRTMGMQQSNELADVANVLFSEMNHLVHNLWTCGFVLCERDRQEDEWWLSLEDGFSRGFYLPNVNDYAHAMLYEGWLQDEAFRTVQLDGDKLQAHYDWLMEIPVAKNIFDDMEAAGMQRPDWQKLHAAYFSKGYLVLITREPCGEEEIFKRFAQVFDQTYTRFLDLQKAEAQAREAKIEAALERVRSRSLAMHKTDELQEVVRVVAEELKNTGVILDTWGAVICTYFQDSKDVIHWTATEDPSHPSVSYLLPYFKDELFDEAWASKNRGDDYFAKVFSYDVKNAFFNHAFEHSDYRQLPDEYKKIILESKNHGLAWAWSKNSAIMIPSIKGELPSEEEKEILIRFAKVFEQSFIRFLDLKKAEAQAREAKIEAALEKVRSRSLAMHDSNELQEVVTTVFERMKELNIEMDSAQIAIFNDGNKDFEFWIATPNQKRTESFRIEEWDFPLIKDLFKARKKRLDFWSKRYSFEEKNQWFNYAFKNTDFRFHSKERKRFLLDAEAYSLSIAFSKNTGIQVNNFSGKLLSESEIDTLKRFARVFEQAYVRFLDLQKAEAQAREAQIEVALERVRSRTMAMQRSDELAETVSVLFKQLLDLGVKSTQLRTCGIVTFKENEPLGEIWITDITGEIISDSFDAPYDEAPAYKNIYSKWKSGEKFLELNLKGDEFLEHLSFVKKYSAVPNINLDEIKKLYKEIFFYVIYFSQGYLFIISYEALTEYHEIFKRFGALFHQTYTRFLDFKKVEAQNKIIQADNDRKTKELEDARQLQLSMLPKILPQLPNLDIAVYMKTATEVGGDYYDFNVDKNGTLTVVVGDATGHGMMSGMMVSIMKSFFISNRSSIDLKEFFENTNNSLKEMQLGRLMMPLIGVQITSEKIIATNAGMPSLLYFRNKSQKAGEFVSNNLPLGGMKGTKFLLKAVKYEKGDTILLMSDGFAELQNSKNEQYGYIRIKEKFRSLVHKSSDEIIEELKTTALEWTNGAEPDDDVTFVVIKVK